MTQGLIKFKQLLASVSLDLNDISKGASPSKIQCLINNVDSLLKVYAANYTLLSHINNEIEGISNGYQEFIACIRDIQDNFGGQIPASHYIKLASSLNVIGENVKNITY